MASAMHWACYHRKAEHCLFLYCSIAFKLSHWQLWLTCFICFTDSLWYPSSLLLFKRLLETHTFQETPKNTLSLYFILLLGESKIHSRLYIVFLLCLVQLICRILCWHAMLFLFLLFRMDFRCARISWKIQAPEMSLPPWCFFCSCFGNSCCQFALLCILQRTVISSSRLKLPDTAYNFAY